MLLTGFSAAPAAAYFTGAPASATASATVGTLQATTVSATAGAGIVALTWTPVSAPTGANVTYYVTRMGGTVGGNCPSSAAGATATTSCTDSGLTRGSYSYTVTAIWQSWTSTSAAAPVTVSSGSLTHFVVTAPASATAGAAFSVTVTAEDAAGNTVVTYTGSQVVSFSGPSNSPNATAPTYPASVTFSGGVATASVTLYDVQSTTLTAAQASVSGVSGSITVGPGANHQIAASASSPQVAGTAFTVTLTAQDAWGNIPGTLAGTKSVSFSGPTSSPNGGAPVYPATASFTAGQATVSVTLKDAQTATVTASDTTDGFGGVASAGIVVGPASASAFSVSTPASPTAGVAFSETITALDAYGNTATAYTGSKTVSFSGPSSSPGGTAPAYPSPVSFTSGVGSPSITLFDAQTTTLTATQGTIAGVSGSFTVAPSSAASLAFTRQPAGATAGASFTTQPVVTAKDAYGNVATGYAQTVTLSIKSGTGPAGAVLSGCSSTLSAGVTTFSGCEVSLSGTPAYQLNASDGTLTASSSAFTAAGSTTVTKTAAGTYTLTAPAGVTLFTFTMKGAGGGGGRSGAAGGSGGTVSGTITIPRSATSTTFTVIVGGAGAGSTGAAGGNGGASGTGCAAGGSGGTATTSGGGGGGAATCIYLSGAPAGTIVAVGGGGGGGAGSSSAAGGAGGGGPTTNPGSSTAASGATVSSAAGGAGGSTLTAGAFPFAITNTGGAGGTGSVSAGGTGGICSAGACGPGGTGGSGATFGAGGGGGGEASGGAGGAARSGSSNFAAGGGGGSAYTGGAQSGSSNYTVTVTSASGGGGGAGGSAGAGGTAGSVSFTGPALTLA
jgi:hypothetical protein